MTTVLDEFEQELKPSSTLAHCQVINPPNLPVSQLDKIKPPYGFFIPLDKAEEVGFYPTANWQLTEVEFGEGKKSATVQGYLSTKCRMVILHRSPIEVEGLDAEDRYYYLGVAYKRGQITEVGQQAKTSVKVGTKSMFRTRTRMLVFFLDEENNLLHNSPLKLTSRGGFGGSFGNELRQYYEEVNKVFSKLKKKSGMQLSPAALARVAVDISLGYHKGEGKAPFACVKSRLAPAIDQVGMVKMAERRDYEVQLTGVPIESLLISGSTDSGKALIQAYKDYETFALPNAGNADKVIESEPEDELAVPQPVAVGDSWDGEF